MLADSSRWGMQDLIRRYEGVISTRVGYTGGDVPNATYRNHGTHAEAIEITFDPTRLSYGDILEFFFQIHDPTTLNRQGNDVGLSYRSAIFYTSQDEKRRRWNKPLPMSTHQGCGGKGRHRGRSGRGFLASGARASRLSRTDPERLHVPLRSSQLEARIEKGQLASVIEARYAEAEARRIASAKDQSFAFSFKSLFTGLS